MSVSKIVTSLTISLSVFLAIGIMISLSTKGNAGMAESGSRGVGTSVIVGGDQVQAQNNGSSRALRLNPDGGQVEIGQYGIHAPHAYGRVNADGSPRSFSSNITATHRHELGRYDIHIAGGVHSGDVVMITPYNRPAAALVDIEQEGYQVTMFALSTGDLDDVGFSFVIYRP